MPNDKRNEQQKKAYAKNPRKFLDYAAKYRVANGEKVRAYSRKSYAELSKDPEWKKAHFAKGNAWRAANRDHVRQKERERWAKKPELRERRAAYRKENPERFSEWQRKSREKHYLRSMVRQAQSRAIRAKLPFDLTEEWLRARWTNKCEVTGIEFVRGRGHGAPQALSPSIDRINPERGYVQNNCRAVIWAFNRFKGNGTDEMVLTVATAIVNGGKLGSIGLSVKHDPS